MQSMGDIATFSGAVRAFVLDLSKIADDIRLLASGPRTGLAEILLPAVQPGSSIMPGKVNPSIAEMVNQVCYQVIGLDTTVAMAAEGGAARAQRDDAGHHPQHRLRADDPRARRAGVRREVRARHRGRRGAVRPLAGTQSGARHRARAQASATPRRPSSPRRRSRPASPSSSWWCRRDCSKGKELDEVLDLRAMTELGVPGGGKGLPGGG